VRKLAAATANAAAIGTSSRKEPRARPERASVGGAKSCGPLALGRPFGDRRKRNTNPPPVPRRCAHLAVTSRMPCRNAGSPPVGRSFIHRPLAPCSRLATPSSPSSRISPRLPRRRARHDGNVVATHGSVRVEPTLIKRRTGEEIEASHLTQTPTRPAGPVAAATCRRHDDPRFWLGRRALQGDRGRARGGLGRPIGDGSVHSEL
jgi:hypothetical protein